jgi:predicted lysophospholipase L1 biosynthesis ABC-type transport system permease subunit
VNYQATGATPLVLAFTLAAAATVALALSMVASVRRRKRDLAVLKTLGFVRKQMLATVGVQAFVTATVAVAVGVPLGVAAGRQLWVAFARSIYAVPEPTVPASVALAAAGAVAIAVAVAVIPGRLAVRTPAADVLRAD